MGLFKQKPAVNREVEETEIDRSFEKISFKDQGHRESKEQEGDPIVFNAALNALYSSYEKQCKADKRLQDKKNEPIRAEISNQEGLKAGCSSKNDVLKNQELTKIENDIQQCNEAINTVSSDPKKYGLDEDIPPIVKTEFTIGCIILSAVGIFLSIFYISASYSAFFKDWDSDKGTGIAAKIFDGDAFVDAWTDDITTGLFVTLTFVIFLGLGFLLHVFQKESSRKKWMKISALLIITFIFDCILAYMIEDEVYRLTETINSKPFNIPLAFQKVEFWAIIFAGFVTYLIWGLVFDHTMKKWEEFSPIIIFKRDKRDLMKELKLDQSKIINDIGNNENEIESISSNLNMLREKLTNISIPLINYIERHNLYVLGWLTGITACSYADSEKADKKVKCQVVAENFINNLKVTE
tara:strand:+ start:1283 stop:2512 length:1230 start_codon:yes stop_codon:yes gene_type:complete